MKRFTIYDLRFWIGGPRTSPSARSKPADSCLCITDGQREVLGPSNSPPAPRRLTTSEFSIFNFQFAICNFLLGLLLVLPAAAQDTNIFIPDGGFAPDGTAEAMRYMVSNALVQYGEMISTNITGSNGLDQADSAGARNSESSDTNLTSETEKPGASQRHESRSQWLDRQRAQQASAVASAQARETGRTPSLARDDTPARPDYSAFHVVYERNIFDPNRVPHQVVRNRSSERTTSVQSFALVGTMSYQKGTFAFFDGTSTDYKKALKLSDNIAGYKITSITPDLVDLAFGTNHVELHVGMQMRSEEGGPWVASSQAPSYADTSTASSPVASTSNSNSSSSNEPASTGNESDVLKRLMQRREQE